MTEVDKHYRQWVHERGKIGNYRNLSFSTTIREAFRAGYAVNTARIAELEAAAPKWIPYKEGDVVEDGWYLVTYKGSSGIAEMTSGVWYFIDANLRLYQHHVTAYRPLPPAFNGDAV